MLASVASSASLSVRIAATASVKRRASRREVRPKISQTRPSRISGVLAVAAQPIQACRLGPGQACQSA